MCHAQVSHKWLYHLDACAGSVLTPHDYVTNVQKRLGNRVWVGGGQCRCCGSFRDRQLEHAETCSTAEATRGHFACVDAVASSNAAAVRRDTAQAAFDRKISHHGHQQAPGIHRASSKKSTHSACGGRFWPRHGKGCDLRKEPGVIDWWTRGEGRISGKGQLLRERPCLDLSQKIQGQEVLPRIKAAVAHLGSP